MRWWALWRGVRRVRPLSAPRGRVVRRRARAFSSLASIVPVANGTAGSSQGARSAARRHTAAHRWRGGTQRTRAIGVEKVERLANLLLLLLRERLLGLGGRPFRGRHANGRTPRLTAQPCVRGRNSYHWMRSTPIDDSEVLLSYCSAVPTRSACPAQAGSQVPPLAKGDTPSPSVRPDPSDAAPTAPASLCLSESLRQAQSL